MIKLQEKDKQELKNKVATVEAELTTLKTDMDSHPNFSVPIDYIILYVDI